MRTYFACAAWPVCAAAMFAVAAEAGAADNVMQPIAPATVAVHFVSSEALDFKTLLPAPPAAGSVAAQADLDAVLQVQDWRTPEQVAWAQLVASDNAFNHAGIIGAWFKPENLPLTAAFFKDLGDDLRAIDAASKKPFQRPRPPAVDPAVKPCVPVPASTSYPSGSGMQAYVWAELLSQLFPAKRDELMARAFRAGWGRVIGGVHFPSDIVAGRQLARACLAECGRNPAFRDALAKCRREVDRFVAGKSG